MRRGNGELISKSELTFFAQDSPRLFSAGVSTDLQAPNNANTAWTVLTTTLAEFEHYISDLADPAYDPDQYYSSSSKGGGSHDIFKQTKDAASKVKAKGKAKQGNGIAGPVDPEEAARLERQAQWQVRKALEGRLPAVKKAMEVRRTVMFFR